MAISRAAVIKAVDAGRWLKVADTELGIKGDTVELRESNVASRYTNLNVLDAQIPAIYWYPNQWNDQTKTLFDAAYGYQIRDKFFSDAEGAASFGISLTPNVAGGQKTANVLDRTAVLYSYDVGAYIYVTNPGDPVTSWEVLTVTDAYQATRFDNLVTVQDWLEQTAYGNVPYGYGIEQFAFTKDPSIGSGSLTIFPAVATKTILRAYVPYSNQEAAYLRIDDTGVPIINMVFSYVGNPWEGTRFQNLNDFKDIVDQRADFFGTSFRQGWEVPQFFWTQTTKTPAANPFEDFFTNDPCGQVTVEGKYANTYEHIVATAQEFCFDWGRFYHTMWSGVFQGDIWGFADYKCFFAWFSTQDHSKLEEWLYSIWGEYACA